MSRMTHGWPARVLSAAVATGLVLAISACGRRGDPVAPSTAAVLATDEQGNVVEQPAAPAAVDRPFILDPLLR